MLQQQNSYYVSGQVNKGLHTVFDLKGAQNKFFYENSVCYFEENITVRASEQ